MNKTSKYALSLLAATALLGAGSAQADPILLDDFEVEQDVGNLGLPGFIPESSQVGPDSSILGGFRDMQATGNADSFLENRLQVVNGALGFSNNADTEGTGIVVWDGDDDPTVVDTEGLGGIDITNNNGWELDGIWVEILSADLPGLELGFTIWDVDGNSSNISRLFNSPILLGEGLEEYFLFEDFVGNADLTNVGAIQLEISGPEEIDAAIDLIQIGRPHDSQDVPEPLTSLWALAGISALGGMSLKRKASNKD